MNDAELDAKLARISARMQGRRGEIRRALERHPDLLAQLEAARKTFGGSLKYLRTAELTEGRDLPPHAPLEPVAHKTWSPNCDRSPKRSSE